MTQPRPYLRPLVTRPGDIRSIEAFGLDMKVLLSTEESGGLISVLMVRHDPGEGPPDHVHFSQDELFFVIDGTYAVTVGGESETAGPGTLVFIPRNAVHRFKNVGETTACMLDWSLPGGQDHYFEAISALAAGGGFSREKVMEVSKKFDTNFPDAC